MTLMRVKLIGISELPLKQEGLGPFHFPIAISLRLVLRNGTRHLSYSEKGSSFHLHIDVQPLCAVWKSSYLLCEDPDKVMIVRAARLVSKTFTSCSSNPTPALSKSRLPILFHHRWVKNCHSYGQECEYCAERKMRSFVTIDGRIGNNTAQMNASTLHQNVTPFCHCKSWTQICISLTQFELEQSHEASSMPRGCSTDSLILN